MQGEREGGGGKDCLSKDIMRIWTMTNKRFFTFRGMLGVSDHEYFLCADVVFSQLKLCQMCGYVGLKGWVWGRGGAIGLWEMGQLIFSMEPEWRELYTLALKATTASKGFCT